MVQNIMHSFPYFELLILAASAGIAASEAIRVTGTPFDTTQCSNLPKSLVSEIQTYQSIANRIFSAATKNSFKGKTYKQLEYIADTFGPRPSGSRALDSVLNYILEQLTMQGLANLRAETVDVPKVTRGRQYATMLEPRLQKMELVAAGYSSSTSPLGLTAQIILIPSLEFLMANKMKVLGKIVVFDYDALSSTFLVAEQAGAVAILTRASVSFSIYSLTQQKGSKKIKIPVAIVTNEDVDLFGRLTKRGYNIKLNIVIENKVTMTKSRNIMAELRGRLIPNQFVLVGGHTDSWHFSQGTQDDGFAIALVLQIPKLLKELNLIPKRTVRPIFWTAEELGDIGSAANVKVHANELAKHSAVLEPDRGCFKPVGYTFGSMNVQFGCILNEIVKLQNKSIPTNYLYTAANIPTDVGKFVEKGIPAAEMNGNDGRYFWYHHTKADTMSVVSSYQLDRCLAFLATTTFILADLDTMVPRN